MTTLPTTLTRGARRLALALTVGFGAVLGAGLANAAEVVVYKSPWCGCCQAWADGLAADGYSVEVKPIENMDMVKKMFGVPAALEACHTALVDGYVVEGHAPTADIARLLAERPEARGIAVPGMPGGSLGMEGGESEPYDVLLFDAAGKSTLYASY